MEHRLRWPRADYSPSSTDHRFSSPVSTLSLSLSLFLSLSLLHDISLFDTHCSSRLGRYSMTMHAASSAYSICPVFDPSLMRGYNSIRTRGDVEYVSAGLSTRRFFIFLMLPWLRATHIYVYNTSAMCIYVGMLLSFPLDE